MRGLYTRRRPGHCTGGRAALTLTAAALTGPGPSPPPVLRLSAFCENFRSALFCKKRKGRLPGLIPPLNAKSRCCICSTMRVLSAISPRAFGVGQDWLPSGLTDVAPCNIPAQAQPLHISMDYLKYSMFCLMCQAFCAPFSSISNKRLDMVPFCVIASNYTAF